MSQLGQPVMRVLQPAAQVMNLTPLPHIMKKTLLGQSSINDMPLWARVGIGALSTIGMASGAYHGYKRNNSVGWAVAWALLGGALPVITVPISIAQGFGKRKGR